MRKKYPYVDSAGQHFPDANKGEEMYYALDLTPYSLAEAETITSVVWILPKELTNKDSYVLEDGSEAHIKISSPIAGIFEVVAKINSEDTGKVQTNYVNIILKVI